MTLLLNNFPVEVPDEITPGLDARVSSAWHIAHLKDTNGTCSYEAWRSSGLMDGYNATIEFIAAVAKPGVKLKQEFPGKTDREIIAECFEHVKDGEAQAFWEWYTEKKGWKKLLAEPSESNTPDLAATENTSV